MAIEIARSNEVPAASGGLRGRSGSNENAEGASSFASALASADREPSADALAAARSARSNEGTHRTVEQRTAGSGTSNAANGAASDDAARAAADRAASNRDAARRDGADQRGAGRDATAASISGDAASVDGRGRNDGGRDRDVGRRDTTSSSDASGNASVNAAPGTPAAATAVVATPAADTSALLLAQSNLTAVSASSALDASAGATAAALAQAQQAAHGLAGVAGVQGQGGATTLPDSTVAGLTGVGSAASTAGAANPQDLLASQSAAQTASTQRAAATPAALPGTVKDTGTVDSHSAALGVALLDRTGGKKEAGKDMARTALTQEAAALGRTPTSAAATAAAAATADAAAASRAAVSTTIAPVAETVALAQAAAASIPGEGNSPWRRIERPGDASTPSAGAGSLGFDATGSASSSTASTDAAAAAANAGTGSAEFMERMVDQVSWWMAHRSQGAELKLDLPGGQPVSVSVQVQGNEAQVAFRSDHPEARQWLNAAMPQLKEMLGNEGLMLSGSSVGQSGSGAEQEAARDAQRAWRSENGGSANTATSAIDTSMTTAARPRTVSERALDLYV